MKKIIYCLMFMFFSNYISAVSIDNEANELLSAFLKPGANHKMLTSRLIPTAKDCKTFFIESESDKACAAYQKLWADKRSVIAPKSKQTEVILFSASLEEIKNGTGNGKDFPGGYKKIIHKIKPRIMIYRFKFVESGQKSGMADKFHSIERREPEGILLLVPGADMLRIAGDHDSRAGCLICHALHTP